MPKIDLLNGETGKLESFEPVDAREILANADTIYSVPDETIAGIGGPTVATELKDGESVPQLQGADAEMQTGLSVEKYGREAVVKAQVGDATVTTAVTSQNPQTTTGELIRPDFDDMTVAEMREYADQHNIDLGESTLKADIAKKLKRS